MKIHEAESPLFYGPQVKRPLRIRVLQVLSLLLAFAGLILLYLYSVNRDIPLVRAGDLSATMNFATVRMTGGIVRDAYIFKSGGIVFDLDDGSGVITIMGGRAQADTLKTENRLPQRGDYVEVAGRLSISAEQDPVLRLLSAGQLQLSRRPVAASAVTHIRLADITAAQKGERVSVTGVLRKISVPKPGSDAPYILTLEEDHAELPVVFWDTVLKDMGGKFPEPGERLRACGRIDVYRDAVQLKIGEAADLRAVEAAE